MLLWRHVMLVSMYIRDLVFSSPWHGIIVLRRASSIASELRRNNMFPTMAMPSSSSGNSLWVESSQLWRMQARRNAVDDRHSPIVEAGFSKCPMLRVATHCSLMLIGLWPSGCVHTKRTNMLRFKLGLGNHKNPVTLAGNQDDLAAKEISCLGRGRKLAFCESSSSPIASSS